MNHRNRTGAWGWAMTLGTVLVYDSWAVLTRRETMSAAFRRAVNHPKRRWRVTGLSAYLVLHLYAPACVRRFDPLRALAEIAEAK